MQGAERRQGQRQREWEAWIMEGMERGRHGDRDRAREGGRKGERQRQSK